MQPSIKRLQPYVLLGSVLLVALVWGGCHLYEAWFRSDETKIRASLQALEEAGRTRNARAVLAEVDEAYQDPHTPDKERLTQYVRYWVLRNQTQDVELAFENVEVDFSDADPDHATVTLQVTGNAPVTQVMRYLRSSGGVSLRYVRRGRTWRILTAARAGELPAPPVDIPATPADAN